MNDYIERYIYAVTRGLSSRQREDVERELRSLISDMLEARCKDAPPSDTDIRVVLAELGTARELAAKYNGDNERYLIGSKYYAKYIMLLKLVLGCVFFGLTLATCISLAIGDMTWYEGLASFADVLRSGLLSAFAFITILFAIFERKGVDFGEEDEWNLPPVPVKSERISLGETIASLIFTAIFAIIFIGFPQLIGYFSKSVWIPFFNVDVVRSLWWTICAVALLNVVQHTAALIELRHSRRYTVIASITSLLSLPFMVYFWLHGELFNPEFLARILPHVGGSDGIVAYLFDRLPWILAAVTIFAGLLEQFTLLRAAKKN